MSLDQFSTSSEVKRKSPALAALPLFVDVALSLWVYPGKSRDQYRHEQGARNLLDDAYAACLAYERHDVAKARAREHRHAQVKRIRVDERAVLPHDQVRLRV